MAFEHDQCVILNGFHLQYCEHLNNGNIVNHSVYRRWFGILSNIEILVISHPNYVCQKWLTCLTWITDWITSIQFPFENIFTILLFIKRIRVRNTYRTRTHSVCVICLHDSQQATNVENWKHSKRAKQTIERERKKNSWQFFVCDLIYRVFQAHLPKTSAPTK